MDFIKTIHINTSEKCIVIIIFYIITYKSIQNIDVYNVVIKYI